MSVRLMRDSPPGTILMTADTVGGVWTYALDLARGMTAKGSRVVLATMGEPLSPTQQEEADQVRGLQVIESAYKLEWMHDPWADLDAAGEWLLELEQRVAPDVVHLNGYAHGALPWKAPVLVVGHSCVLSWWSAVKGESAPASWDEYRRRVRDGLRNATMVAAPTRAMLNALETHYGPLQANRVVSNGRAPGHFLNRQEKQRYIFAAGRLGDEAKNIRTLGEAARNLPWPVFVAGAERDASGNELLPSNVTHCGKLSPVELADWMGKAAIYCLPARYEPFGLSILEAAISGCTLVLGDIPSLRELWEGCAAFVPPNDPAAIREILNQLISDPKRRAELAASARQRAQHFSFERFIEGYLQVYHDLRTANPRRQSLAA